MEHVWQHTSKISNLNALPVPMLKQVYTFSLLDSFFASIFQVFFWRSFFRTFCDFGVPRAPKIGAFGVHFEDFFVIR